MPIHTLFDFIAWIAAAMTGQWVARRYLPPSARTRTLFADPAYFIALGLGALAGALIFGSLNLAMAGRFALGHSIAGAIGGGVTGVEVYKAMRGIKESTGLIFVAPLAAGIAIGRIGCFLAGLPDYTYGTATSLPWGVDFGDGVNRHPVQLYESAAMMAFLVAFIVLLRARNRFIVANGFYLFVGWYGLQRFFWEFLKPYPLIAGPFNLFQILCAALLSYSLIMVSRNYGYRQAP